MHSSPKSAQFGDEVGTRVGVLDGLPVIGAEVGLVEGVAVGLVEGVAVGLVDGVVVGLVDGCAVGVALGSMVGSSVVGLAVGLGVSWHR